MAMDDYLLTILACPQTKEPVAMAESDVLERLNAAIGEGRIVNKDGTAVEEALEAGLVRQDGQVLYPVRNDIPIMLIGEGIELSQLNKPAS